MSKWYTVKVTSVRMVLVEVHDGETELIEAADAMQVAMDNSSGNDLEAEVDSGPFLVGSDEYESWQRHADERLPL